MNNILKSSFLTRVIVLFTVLLYLFFAYKLQRTDYYLLVITYSLLFFTFFYFTFYRKLDFKFLVSIAFLFRILFLFAIPNLSQDFYRFIWDGRMIISGMNPYLSLPETFIQLHNYPISQAQELYQGMGILNASHYTNYPPINQFCFAIAGLFSRNSIVGAAIVMRLLIILADLGILFFGKKLLKQLHLPVNNIFWYLLNPFIIIELTGNLHFESVMLFFLIWSIYLLHKGLWKTAGVIFALSALVKLIPLLFLPLFIQKLELKKSLVFYTIVLGTVILFFIPFYSPLLITNYSNSVGLWFRNFEFNASIYYIFREIGYQFRGWNEIAIIGKILPIIVLVFIVIISFLRNNKTTLQLITVMLFAISFYYFNATTVHPWYISTLVLLTLFTNYKFPLVWSLIIIISYLAYANNLNKENLYIIALEYIIVYVFLFWDIFLIYKKRKILM